MPTRPRPTCRPGKALQAEGRTLQQQVAILAPDLKAKKLAAFQAREQSLQGAAQRKDEQIKAGLRPGAPDDGRQLGPILQQLVKERGANMVLDKQAVVFAHPRAALTSPAMSSTGWTRRCRRFKINLNAPARRRRKK